LAQRDISRLLPELLIDHPDLTPPESLRETWQRHRFYGAIAKTILKNQPQVMLLEDMQYCDEDTLELLQYLLQYEKSMHILFLGTLRPGELYPGHPLLSFSIDLRRGDHLTELHLDPPEEKNWGISRWQGQAFHPGPGFFYALPARPGQHVVKFYSHRPLKIEIVNLKGSAF
jgi:hypothetical protein